MSTERFERLEMRALTSVTRVAVCGVLLLACTNSGRRIEAELSQALKTHSSGVVVSRYVPGIWDRMCVVMPYSTSASIDSLLGFRWEGAERTGIASDDGHALLLFLHRDAVFHSVMYPREKGDFTQPVSTSYCVPREQAIFRTTSGKTAAWPAVQLVVPKK